MADKKILLVEGRDDLIVVRELCRAHGLESIYGEIRDEGGVETLLQGLEVRLRESELVALGILVDADADLASRWQALRIRLVKSGYPVPDQPLKGGTILAPPENALLPRVGIWLMPDNKASGMLEDFLKRLVPQNSPLFAHAKSSIQTIPSAERLFSDAAAPKALIHTWLAWQEEPGKPLGQSITAKYLNSNAPEVQEFLSWLRRLFS